MEWGTSEDSVSCFLALLTVGHTHPTMNPAPRLVVGAVYRELGEKMKVWL